MYLVSGSTLSMLDDIYIYVHIYRYLRSQPAFQLHFFFLFFLSFFDPQIDTFRKILHHGLKKTKNNNGTLLATEETETESSLHIYIHLHIPRAA